MELQEPGPLSAHYAAHQEEQVTCAWGLCLRLQPDARSTPSDLAPAHSADLRCEHQQDKG